MQRCFAIFPPVLVFLLLAAAPAHAHKVNIFAYVEDGRVYTESGFSKTSRVQKGTVEVSDAQTGELLLTGQTDTEGRFDFAIPQGATHGLKLVIKAGEGHQGDWEVRPEELAEGAAGSAGGTPESHEAPDTAPGTTQVLLGLGAIVVVFGALALIRRKKDKP